MKSPPTITNLGQRICIIGPSSGGKSTLAKHLGSKLKLPVCYLDQLAHVPHTQWKRLDDTSLKTKHDDYINNNTKWIIEGNYSFLMPQRFAQATYIIWLDFHPLGAVRRYIKRTLIGNKTRPGNLLGARTQFSWQQLSHMLFTAPKLRPKYRALIEASCKPYLRLHSFKQLKKLYKHFGLIFEADL